MDEQDNNFSSKSELERKIQAGIHGAPELKKAEKDQHLGEFKERVIKALTFDQIQEEGTYPEILQAIRHPNATRLKISRQVELSYARDYISLAKDEGLSFTTVDNPDYQGPIGLVVVADQAVELNEDIYVESRVERLRAKGLPEELIHATGEKLCSDCWDELANKAAEELSNYDKLSFWERVSGKACRSCSNT